MAVKLKDGFFLGDEYSASDMDFLFANKIKRIVNCGIPNLRTTGVSSLTFNWVDNDSQIILDVRDQVICEFVNFVEEGETLVCSEKGQSRSVTIVVAYFMFVYKWGLNKALEFMQSRKDFIAIKPGFHRQLVAFERRLERNGNELSRDWQLHAGMTEEHLVIRNTFLNSKKAACTKDSLQANLHSKGGPRVVWRDMTRNMSLEIEGGSRGVVPGKSILKKTTPVTNTQRYVESNFPKTPQVKYYARPPSPMVRSRVVVPLVRAPSPMARSRSVTPNQNIRTPSPARSFRSPSPARVAFNNQTVVDSTFRISVDKPRSLIASQLRRAPAPFVTSLDRPHSTPLWRLR